MGTKKVEEAGSCLWLISHQLSEALLGNTGPIFSMEAGMANI